MHASSDQFAYTDRIIHLSYPVKLHHEESYEWSGFTT